MLGEFICEPRVAYFSMGPWEPADWARPLEAKIAVPIEQRRVWVSAWLYVLENQWGARQPVLLLDTDLPENAPEDRPITHHLYGGDESYRLKQEIVLGIGGVRLLHALGFEIRQYHMNEGHSALLGVELLRKHTYAPDELQPGESRYDIPLVRGKCRFTTHTPVDAGHDRFSYDLVARTLGADFIEIATLKRLAGDTDLNMTRLALNLSEYVNGVAERHAETSRKMFPGYRVHAITNGVHPFTWTCESLRQLYNQYVPSWCHEPELLVRVDAAIPDPQLWSDHLQAKQQLIEHIRSSTGRSLDARLPVLGFARRMTAYKRPDLIFSDLQRLEAIARRYPFQMVLAGKAHPRDEGGKRLIEAIHTYMQSIADVVQVVYLPNYDFALARLLVAGSDVWLNTPLPPFEASGTSGMKAAFNGVPNLSVLDGWWVEGCIEGATGWAVQSSGVADSDARSLYDKLQNVVLPLTTPRTAPAG